MPPGSSEQAEPPAARLSGLPRVAVVGRPNAGKSTLVNRLAGRKGSIVGPTPGLTRDRIDVAVEWAGRSFILHDTGGVMATSIRRPGSSMGDKVAARAIASAREADLVLFVLDARTGITEDDMALARSLQRFTAPVVVAANKVDNEAQELEIAAMWALGLGEPLPVSALHGRGSGDLLDRITELLPEAAEQGDGASETSIAIAGRPNVGKSSIFNRIIGSDRALVTDQPGTTRDSIDDIAELGGVAYRFIDTAGIRRHARTQGVEIFSASRTRAAIERADVVLVVIDAAEGVTSQDQRIAQMVAGSGAAAVLILNKWDLIEDEDRARAVEAEVKDKLRFIHYAPLVRTSADTGRGIAKLPRMLAEVMEHRGARIPTAGINTLVQDAQEANPPPRIAGRRIRILYATQAGVAPPLFALFSSGVIGDQWLRYLEHRIRAEQPFTGNPIRFNVKPREKKGARRGASLG